MTLALTIVAVYLWTAICLVAWQVRKVKLRMLRYHAAIHLLATQHPDVKKDLLKLLEEE